jgi:hypothetical protein
MPKISVVDPDLHCLIREGKNDPQKHQKIEEISCLEVLDVLF